MKQSNKLPQKVKAYFTVEAAMVLSVVLSVIVIVVYIMLFQYNRCLMEQDVSTLVLKSSTMQITDKETLVKELKKQEQQIDQDKYIAWKNETVVWKMEQDEVRVEQKGVLLFPFAGKYENNQEAWWKANVTYKNRYVSPVVFLRTYHKLIGGE